MTTEQVLAFAIIGAVIALLVWDRLRYDVVGLLALVTAMAVGLVPEEQAFRGFSDEIVIIVGAALVVSAGVARSGVVEVAMKPLSARMRTPAIQVMVLAGAVTVLSAVVKNVGALAMLMPVAVQIAARTGTPVSHLLMPMAFGSLLGGLMTLVGTSPNIIVSRMRQDILGEPFRMFDFTPVGAVLAAAGVAFLAVGWRLLPQRRARAAAEAFSIDDFTAEARLPAGSPFVGRTVAEFEEMGEGDVTIAAIVRERHHRYVPSGHWVLYEGDLLVLECDTRALARIVRNAGLELSEGRTSDAARGSDVPTVVEAVVTRGSPLIGRTVEDLALRGRYGVNLLALSRRGQPIRQRLRRIRFRFGDLVVFQVRADDAHETLATLGCLPLAERDLPIGRPRKRRLTVAIVGVTVVLVATGTLHVAPAFFGAAVAMLLFGVLTPGEAYEAVEWPVLVLFGALIPVSETLQSTGGTELIAGWLSVAAGALPPVGALALMMVAAMAVTPFLNNAATVLVMAPIGASLAAHLGLRPDAFLMAVAVGAGCDFLTPIGHQCNTLVMGPGGYRFADYSRLGLPLSLLVIVIGTAAIALVWPLAPG
ncbi:SLC13 family permease [Azospirillum halopraeferens]|uniref:SLC13 family permease n=1 Tax=Azospirillum halopraeferens TaxID=34010 RepID=UPI00042565E9|nr:SLC13 family permease [Azospirillum halopraeferens]